LPSDGRLALYVGNLKPEKGVLDLVDAWTRVRGAQLAIVGGGPLRDELRARAGESVRVVGPEPLARVPLWMAAADLVVLPSHSEGTPNVVLEAFASGRRVVATAVGGVPDLVTEPALGVLVPTRAPDVLGDALARELDVAYDPAEVARLGARGSWTASAAALHEVLAQARATVERS
jgi:glycosyltransferase involved in cell wall biosynthesis